MILKLQTNCINKNYISGYADRIRRFTEKKHVKGKLTDVPILEFDLLVLNEGWDNKNQKQKVFISPFKARAEGGKAVAGKWVKTTSFVLLEHTLSRRNGDVLLLIQHIGNAQPTIREVDYDIVEEVV